MMRIISILLVLFALPAFAEERLRSISVSGEGVVVATPATWPN